MFSVRTNANGPDAYYGPSRTVVIRYAGRDVVFVRRDKIPAGDRECTAAPIPTERQA